MSFKKAFPDQQQSGNDVTFFSEGVRLSHYFVEREGLQNYQYVWIFVDTDKKELGFRFLLGPAPQALRLTESGGSTSGKTISCVFLKKHAWIKKIMEAKEVGKRRFEIKEAVIRTTDGARQEAYLVKFPRS